MTRSRPIGGKTATPAAPPGEDSAAPSPPDPASPSRVRVAEFREALGAASAELFLEFRATLPGRLADLEAAVAGAEAGEVREKAHRLTTLANHFAQPALAVAASQLAEAVQAGEAAWARSTRLLSVVRAEAEGVDWSIYGLDAAHD